jgi:Predicted permease
VVRPPRFLASLIVMIIATFFMSLDYDKMTSFVLRQLPKRAEKLLKDIKHSFVLVLLRYGRSYAIIFVITSVELSLGLLFLGINNAPVIALIIAVFDIFPILGTGTILGPWAAIELFRGEYHQALGLIILYVIVTVIRQVMEPRIVGSHVGLHPLITIMSIFIGGSLFGVVGFFGLPITVALLRSLMDGGTIKIFNRRGAEDSDGDDAAADSDSESQDTPPE